MRIFCGILVGLGILFLIVGIWNLSVQLCMFFAERKVRKMSREKKVQRLNAALASFGFCYDEKNDGICSEMYPWQREMGYCRVYDEAAFAMGMVFDCEPVYFNYNGGRYLLELWKGQYGCTTGAEIGLYVNRSADSEQPPEELFYDCVEDEERLPMAYTLYRNGQTIQERSGLHWWLTGFNVGMCSDKDELSMDVCIVFPNVAMCSAFCEGLLRIGYARSTIHVEYSRVYFRFDRPHSPQPDNCGKRCRRRVMRRNCKICKLYCRLSQCFCLHLDRINYIGYCFPLLYRTLIRIGTKCNKRKLCKYRKKFL